MIKELIFAGIIFSLVLTLSSLFIGGVLSQYNIESENMSYLAITENLTSDIVAMEQSLNTTTPSSEFQQGFSYAGIWSSMQITFRLPELYSGIVTDIAQIIGVDVSIMSGALMLILSVIIVFAIIKIIRGFEP